MSFNENNFLKVTQLVSCENSFQTLISLTSEYKLNYTVLSLQIKVINPKQS